MVVGGVIPTMGKAMEDKLLKPKRKNMPING